MIALDKRGAINYYRYMETPKGTYTIPEAADVWIEMINSTTKATQEQKDALIAQIRAAAPITKIVGVGGAFAGTERVDFTGACNNIKRTMREAK